MYATIASRNYRRFVRMIITGLAASALLLAGATTAAHAQDSDEDCQIQLGESGLSRTFSLSQDGPSILNLDGAWSFIRWTRGPCVFYLYNNPNLGGLTNAYGTNIDARIRIGATGAQDEGGWRARSLYFQRVISTQGCRVILGDSGVSQTFYGPDEVADISGWNFIRESLGSCTLIVFNNANFSGRQEEFLANITERVSVEWRIRSIIMQD